MLNYVIKANITGFAPNYIQVITLPVIATRLAGISVFASGSDEINMEAELVLNDDRNHIVIPVSAGFNYYTGDAENNSGIIDANVAIIKNAEHLLILRNTNEATITLILKTCQDEQD